MNCDRSNPGHVRSFDDPDCSLHPFDIMAIHALHQSRR